MAGGVAFPLFRGSFEGKVVSENTDSTRIEATFFHVPEHAEQSQKERYDREGILQVQLQARIQSI